MFLSPVEIPQPISPLSLHTALHKSPKLIPRTRTGFNSKITTGTSSPLGGHPPTEGLRGAHSCARSTNSPVCLPTCSGNIVRAPFACSAHPRALLVTSSLVASQCQCLSQKLAVPLSAPQLCNSFTSPKKKIKMKKRRQKTHIRFGFSRFHSKQHVVNCKESSRNTDLVSRLCKQSCASDTFPAPPSVTH